MEGKYTATITVVDGSTNTATIDADNFDDAVTKFGSIWHSFKPEKIVTRNLTGETKEYTGEDAIKIAKG